MIRLLKSFRTDQHTVKCLYLTEGSKEFLVAWSNIHEGSGNVIEYCLNENYCLAGDELMMDEVIECIKEGETNTNRYIDLYLGIRDTFNSNDCEEIT